MTNGTISQNCIYRVFGIIKRGILIEETKGKPRVSSTYQRRWLNTKRLHKVQSWKTLPNTANVISSWDRKDLVLKTISVVYNWFFIMTISMFSCVGSNVQLTLK